MQASECSFSTGRCTRHW